MTLRKCSRLFVTLFLILWPLTVVRFTYADGDIAFLDPTHKTITAGEPFSWMEASRDWNQDLNTGAGGGVTTISGVNYAIPNVTYAGQDIQVETWRETSGSNVNLKMHFSIPDNTHHQPTGSSTSTLNKGDRLIIQLDPNNSGHASNDSELDVGAAGVNTTDYRFEIVIKDEAICNQSNMLCGDLTGPKLPVSPSPNNWDTNFDTSASAPTDTQLAALSISGGRYDLTVTIPASYVGLASGANGPEGMTYVYLNDFGHSHPAGGGTVWEMIGTQFPASMGLSVIADNPGVSDLGLVTNSTPASGSWINPSQWASGYFNVNSASATNDINFSASPDWYISEDIRLRLCTTTRFDPTPPAVDNEGVAGWGTNQQTIPNWYQYYPGVNTNDKPCVARIWFRTHRTQPAAAAIQKRFLIVWGRPNIGATKDWFVANLTPVITITAATDTFSFLWNVPKIDFTDHPCLRIYALPADLKNSSGTQYAESDITGITTDANLTAMETFFGVGGHDPRSAQMNFTALHTGNCPTSACLQAALPERDRRLLDPSGVRIVAAGFRPTNDAAPPPTSASVQQMADDKHDNIRVFVEGFGIETPPANVNYAFLKTLGGVATMVSNSDLMKMDNGMTITVDVGNPRVERADVTRNPSVETLSPPRTIFLNVIVKTPNGVAKPTVTVNLGKTYLDPGETTTGTVVVRPKDVTPPSTNFKRWGLSLHAGVSIPQGSFNTFFNPGPNAGVDLEYRFNPTFSLEGIYTFHRFRGETFGNVKVGDLNVHQFSINGKVYGSSSPVRPFFNFGAGAYKFDPGSAHGGLNVGGGLQFDLTPNVAFDAMYNFHNVFTSGQSTRFSTVQAGVRFRF